MLDRRRFLELAGGASLWTATQGPLAWAGSRSPSFALVGTENAIHVFGISGQGSFLEIQEVPTARPAAMTLHGQRLYVANRVSRFGNLPRGTVEAYAIDPGTGCLAFINRAPLSLSGTDPRDLAISPDGRSIVVAIHGGGSYNVLSIEDDGSIGRITGIFKEIGSGPHPAQTSAHPAAVVFDHEGRLLAADMGSDRITVFHLIDGELSVAARCEVAAGSGPASIVLHPDRKHAFAAHALRGSVSAFAYVPGNGLKHQKTLAASPDGAIPTLAMHPSGKVIYSSHGLDLQTWGTNGELVASHRMNKIHAMRATQDSLFALGSDGVFRMDLHRKTLASGMPMRVASLARPLSITVA